MPVARGATRSLRSPRARSKTHRKLLKAPPGRPGRPPQAEGLPHMGGAANRKSAAAMIGCPTRIGYGTTYGLRYTGRVIMALACVSQPVRGVVIQLAPQPVADVRHVH